MNRRQLMITAAAAVAGQVLPEIPTAPAGDYANCRVELYVDVDRDRASWRVEICDRFLEALTLERVVPLRLQRFGAAIKQKIP